MHVVAPMVAPCSTSRSTHPCSYTLDLKLRFGRNLVTSATTRKITGGWLGRRCRQWTDMANNAASCVERATSDMLIGVAFAIAILVMVQNAIIWKSQSGDSSIPCMAEIHTAQGLADVLMEMLGALDPQNREGVQQEVIVDLVEQCRSYQKRVMVLVNNTADEELLCMGLALNDELQHVLRCHDNVAKGTTAVAVGTAENSVAPVVNVNHEDEESDDDFSQLAHRSLRDTLQGRRLKPANPNNEPVRINPILPPPPSFKKSTSDAGMVDYLSGDAYNAERSFPNHSNNTNSVLPLSAPTLSSSSPPPDFINPTAPMFTGHSTYDQRSPTTKSSDRSPLTPRDVQSPLLIPPPPSKYNQRQQFFEQHQALSGSASPSRQIRFLSDGLVGPTVISLLTLLPPLNKRRRKMHFSEIWLILQKPGHLRLQNPMGHFEWMCN
ncbi:hypothetical protein TEA_006418 [Camellia sinensis var. sinensis]|uniref:GAT domain-containing protein n=1 Tax=Camellia sinensis var. sinensis TaxID=542762 RepID=A0A4S4DW00_CAMSN|nr:hypothetical protein TEA_006418 [Camellia sinensis var. sinensis]